MCRMMDKTVNRPGRGMDEGVLVTGGGMITSSGL